MGAKIKAGLRIWAVKVRLAGVWLGGAISKWNGHRPFGHFLGPSWTSPGRFGGQGKQVQAFRPLLGPTSGGGANKSRPFGHFLGFLGGRGKAFRSSLGGGANKSRPFGHFLGLSWGAGQTSPDSGHRTFSHSKQMWDLTALLWGKTKAEQADLRPYSPPMGVKIQAGLLIWAVKVRLAGVWLGGAISKWNGHRPFGHFLGPSWASPGRFGGQGKQVQAFRPLLGTLGAGQTSPRPFGHLGGRVQTALL